MMSLNPREDSEYADALRAIAQGYQFQVKGTRDEWQGCRAGVGLKKGNEEPAALKSEGRRPKPEGRPELITRNGYVLFESFRAY
jgi:hypothetical protein